MPDGLTLYVMLYSVANFGNNLVIKIRSWDYSRSETALELEINPFGNNVPCRNYHSRIKMIVTYATLVKIRKRYKLRTGHIKRS